MFFPLATQDMRLLRFNHKDDAVQCNNNKLVSGSTSAFLRSARDFLALTVFADGKAWPSVIFTPSFLEFNDKSPTISTEVRSKQVAL